jgi:hypothetical protein
MSVGQRTARAASRTSISPNARKMRTAVSGEVLSRIMSLKERCCSTLAPGMKFVVNTWRKAGSCVPQPSSMRCAIVSARSRSSGVGSRARHPRE